MQELLNAGVGDPGTIAHFFEADCEKVPIFLQGDTSIYSQWFKDKIFKLDKRIPKWLTDMPLHPTEIEDRKILEQIKIMTYNSEGNLEYIN